MAEEKTQENREDIIRVTGELKLINQKLDNHMSHISQKIDTIFKIVWTVSFMVLGLILKAVYTGILNQEEIMGKLKGMWRDLSKPGKVFVAVLVIIFAVILVNYVI